MKNVLVISTEKEELLSNVNDGTNTLYINGTQIPSSDWTGTGNYTATVEGHAVSIAKVDDAAGNVVLENISGYTYRLKKLSSGGGSNVGIESIEQTTTSHEDGGVNIVTCTLTDGTETDFEIRNGQKGSTGAKGDKGDKGDTGATGATGATPNIAMTASVDANTGTPSVDVAKTGTAENPSFALAFHNLKGAGIGADNYKSSVVSSTSGFLNDIAERATTNFGGCFGVTGSTAKDYPFDGDAVIEWACPYAWGGIICTATRYTGSTMEVWKCKVHRTNKTFISPWEKMGGRKVLLWSGSKTSSGTIQLNQNINDFDYLIFDSITNVETYSDILSIPLNNTRANIFHAVGNGTNDGNFPHYRAALYFQFASLSITITSQYNNVNWQLGLLKVWGVKL